MEVFVCKADELGDKEKVIIEHEKIEIGIFRLDGGLYAWRNECAHQGGPVCQGRLFPKVLEPLGEDHTVSVRTYDEDVMHIVCPWHGYEYDLKTGRNAGNPRLRLKAVDVFERDRGVYVRL